MGYLLMLSQIRRMPPLIGYLQEALNERAAGHANAADELDAIRKAAEWDGKGGDAAMYALGRSVLGFDRAQADDKRLAQASNAVYSRAMDVVRKMDRFQEKVKSNGPDWWVIEDTNSIHTPDTVHVDNEYRQQVIQKYADLRAELEAIRREGEAVDLEFGRLLATATGGADGSSELTPIVESGKQVVAIAPPENRPEGTGYWLIDTTLPSDTPTHPAGVTGPYSAPMDPNSKLNTGPTSDWAYPRRNFTSPPIMEYSESYRFRITGTEFTGDTQMVQVNGKWYEAQWQNYQYEVKVNQHETINTPEWSPIKDTLVPNKWTPISMSGILNISHMAPDVRIWLPDSCGGKVTLVDGAVVGPDFQMPPVMYGPR